MSDPDEILEPRDRELSTTARTLWVYAMLSRHSPGGRYLDDLAEDCNMPRRSLERHLSFLEAFGFVRHTGARRYFINAAARLPLGVADHDGIDKVLAEFVEHTGRDVALATLSGTELVMTHLHKNPDGDSLLDEVHPRAVHATGAGKCLLAQLPTAERRRLMILNGMPRYTSATITDFESLEANLREHEGEFWSAKGEYCETGACLAVLAHPGTTHGDTIALTTSVHTEEFTEARVSLVAGLHRAVVRLQPFVGPLLPPSFGPHSN